ncbi:DUF2550 domain-containing protein [Planosporangium thailandense]|uniref:DUF2550 domain-containing protein n=1 Tax=Planosporangium thailandense TaxID=765197 RepID=A0ABX0Y4M8_9ACTN|nr:DUF2550 domain-containing protein [Planosporangium thailandense]NJC73366.1 DUF2550 domain-containing protein [Planosporangium thailandense]
MEILEGIGIGVFVLLFALALLFLRRGFIARSVGTIEMSWRLSTVVPGRGWSPGIGRFAGDELRWYRMFSFSPRPRRTLSRRTLVVEGRRTPDGPERLVLAPDWVIVSCRSKETSVEIAMAQSTLAGFLSWIEAVPPGTVSTRIAAR